MTQPLDRTCHLPARGDIDWQAGEFWVESPFDMRKKDMNLSAFEHNQMYLNVDGHSFLNVSYASGADLDADSRSAIWADFNRDGAPDLLVGSIGGGPLRMFYNRFPTENHRARIRLVGDQASNRSAIGTRVIAHCGGRRIIRDLFAENGFSGHGPAEICLGVGSAERIDRLIIRWPDGRTQAFKDVPVDCQLGITQGRAEYEAHRWAKKKPRSEP